MTARHATTSERMAAVRQKHTRPEMIVRRSAHRLGLRFRVQRRDLPGSPDIVFPKFRVALFVHGCFWHRHENCRRTTMPKSNRAYWSRKFIVNVARDRKKEDALRREGWTVYTIWECETLDEPALAAHLKHLFGVCGKPREKCRIATMDKWD